MNRVVMSFDGFKKYDLVIYDGEVEGFLSRLLRSISIKEKEMDDDVLDAYIPMLGAGHHTFSIDVSWEVDELCRQGYVIGGTVDISSCELEDGMIYGVSPKILTLEDYDKRDKEVVVNEDFVKNLVTEEGKRKGIDRVNGIPVRSIIYNRGNDTLNDNV